MKQVNVIFLSETP